MDWSAVIVAVVAGVSTFAGGYLAKTKEIKIAKMNIDANKEQEACKAANENYQLLFKSVEETREEVNELRKDLAVQREDYGESHEELIEQRGMIQQLMSAIDLLSSRVEKHNGVIERTFRLEERQAADHERIGKIERREEARTQS